MRNLIIFMLFVSMTYGCTPTQVYKTGSAVYKAGCVATTAESRAEIRDKQKLKTNICGDEL